MTQDFRVLSSDLQRLVALTLENNQHNAQTLVQQNQFRDAFRKQSSDLQGLVRSLVPSGQNAASFRFDAQFDTKKLEKAFTQSIRIMSKELEQFARSGKFNLKSLTKALLQMIFSIEQKTQSTLQNIQLQQVGGQLSGILGGIFHQGGEVSAERANVPLNTALFETAPKLHSGGRLNVGLGPAEFPAILQRGETVLTAKQTATVGASPKVDVHIHENSGAKVRTERRQQAGGSERIDVYIEAIEDKLSQRMMRGEGMASSIEGRYNLSPNPTS